MKMHSWWRFLRRNEVDAEQRRELDAYLEIATDENIARGMEPEAARELARRKLGNSTIIQEEVYAMNTWGHIDTLLRHVRITLRSIRRNPVFAVTAILTLALGIGANTAVFSVVDGILLKPLPYPDAHELVAVRLDAPGAGNLTTGSLGLPLSGSMFMTFRDQNQSLQAMGVWSAGKDVVTGVGEPEQIRVIGVSDGLLDALGVMPAIGRLLSTSDQVPGSNRTVLISHEYWLRRFGGDRAITGRKLILGGVPREIVGVMPALFRVEDTTADLILPLQLDPKRQALAGFGLRGVGRLKKDVSIAQANADFGRLIPVWMRSWPSFLSGPKGDSLAISVYESWRIAPGLRSLQENVVGNVGGVLWTVMGVLAIVMLIVCANVANLLLMRMEVRQQEFAIRSALGAGRGRIVQELLVESALLAFAGALLGIGFAYACLRFLVRLGPSNLPRLGEISLDFRSLSFALLLAALSCLFFGLVPAFRSARIAEAIRSVGRAVSLNREGHRTRHVLVVVQVALALMLLISSGLMIRTFQEVSRVNPGFTRPEQVQTMKLMIPVAVAGDAQRVARMESEIMEKLTAIQGVISTGFTSSLPMDENVPDWDGILAEGQTYAGGDRPAMRLYVRVSPGFFETIGTGLAAGRGLTWEDLFSQRHVVLLSEKLARELWGSAASAPGKRVRPGDHSPWYEVIGVVKDVHSSGIQEPAPATVYWPAFHPSPYPTAPPRIVRSPAFVIRHTRGTTQSFLDEVRQAVWSVNSGLPIAGVQTLQEVADRSMARTSFTLVMLAIAGSMALLLSIVGIYGVIAYAVAQQRREMGIRLALGAEPRDVRTMVVVRGLIPSGIGVGVGLVAAALLSRVMSSLLFGVTPLDPITYAAAPMIVLTAAALACHIPARRAAAIDPAETLRSE